MPDFSNRTDEELMSRVAGGMLDASALLFQRYQRSLFNFFLRFGFSRHASEDLVQSVFERLLKYRHTYRPGQPFRSWLYQIARNVRADFQRQNSRWTDQPLDGLEQLADWMESPADQRVENRETLAQLQRAMQQLPVEQLEVLILTRFQGLKYAEVGTMLTCTEGAVKVKVFRALQQLRELFFKLEKL